MHSACVCALCPVQSVATYTEPTAVILLQRSIIFWSLTLRKDRRLKVFENRVLRRVFGPKWDEVTAKWRNLHNEKLNDLYSSPKIFVC